MVLGTTLRLPGEFFTPQSSSVIGEQTYVQRLSTFMRKLPAAETRIQNQQVHLPSDLSTCSHVFIRIDSVRNPLQQPYVGPFRVITRREKYFKVARQGRVETISIDRLKAAHVDSGTVTTSSNSTTDNYRPTSETLIFRPTQEPAPTLIEPHGSQSSLLPETPVVQNEASVSRSGREVVLPVRLCD